MSEKNGAMGRDPGHWITLERNGNFGLDSVVNERLYPYILDYIDKLPHGDIVIADIGAGTAKVSLGNL